MNKLLTITFQKIDVCHNPMTEIIANAHCTLTIQAGSETLVEEHGTFLVYDLPSKENYMCPLTSDAEKLLSNILLVYKVFGLDWDFDMNSIINNLKKAPIAKVYYDLK